MGFCTQEECEEFLRTVPEFERMLVRSGIILIKYWFSISDDEQHFRFMMRIHDPLKQWKLSPMDLESRRRWEAYTLAMEVMLERTHIPEAPWWIVEAVDKKKPGSTASTISSGKSPTTRSSDRRSCCRHARITPTISAIRFPRIDMSPMRTEAALRAD